MKTASQLLVLVAATAASAGAVGLPYGLKKFIPCDGMWAPGGRECPDGMFCWNVGVGEWSLCKPNEIRVDTVEIRR